MDAWLTMYSHTDDLRALTDGGNSPDKLTPEALDTIIKTHISDFPPDIAQDMLNDIINFYQK